VDTETTPYPLCKLETEESILGTSILLSQHAKGGLSILQGSRDLISALVLNAIELDINRLRVILSEVKARNHTRTPRLFYHHLDIEPLL
jgi:hypothetical protein